MIVTGPDPTPPPPAPEVDPTEVAARELEADLARFVTKTACPRYLSETAETWLFLRERDRA